jgi:CheY-like chemotaxis protein
MKDNKSILEMIFPKIDATLLSEIRSGKIDVRSDEEAKEHFNRFGMRDKKFSDFGGHVFPFLAKEGLMRGFVFEEYWNDVGDNETYWFANWHALTKRFKMNIPFVEREPGVWVDPSAEIIEGSAIIPPVVIGKNVKIEAGATVGPYTILDQGWTVERDAEVVYSLTWPTFATEGYQEGLPLQIIRQGARVEKSIIAGRLPVGDHIFKGVIGDGSTFDQSRLIRTVVGLKMSMDSEIDVAKQTKRVLVVDDEKPFRDILVGNLKDAGWEFIETASTLEEAQAKLNSIRYDVIVLDSVLSQEEKEESEGVTILKEQKMDEEARNYGTPTLFWSGHSSMEALKGLSPSEGLTLAERKTVLRNKDPKHVSNLSDLIFKELLKI